MPLILLSAVLLSAPLKAASYLPMSDADLVRQAPIAVRAEVTDRAVRIDRDGRDDLPFTVVTLFRLELFKGEIDETFRVVVPGGVAGDRVWAVPGAPAFDEGQEVVLVLNPLPGRPGEYGLSEFGLSKFDIAADERGRRFAVRPVFEPDEDLVLSKQSTRRTMLWAGGGAVRRDGESFLAALRGVREGRPLGEIAYARPSGDIQPIRRGLRDKFANLGGVEPGNCGGQACLFRWYFETGASPAASVFLTGSQTRLVDDFGSCENDQNCLTEYITAQWHGVAGTDIRISRAAAAGNVEVLMDQDVAHNGTSWTTPYACSGGGAVGIGGPTASGGARTFKGLSPYYAATTGKVSLRRWTCNYPTSVFVEILMHELGHVLGLHHPNQLQSVHSQTTQQQWNDAVMASQAHSPAHTTPQADDIQAMQFYYGTAAPGPAPAADFTVSANPRAGAPVTFTDTSTNSPTGWIWFFGESTAPDNVSRSKNPTHTYAAAGTYNVDLIAGNLNGGSVAHKQVTVTGGAAPGPCVANATTLCLTNDRFRVTAAWRKNTGETGQGTGVELTSDSGYFWFFNPNNIEVVIKTLNACGVNGHYWVFAAGLTNVEVNIQVTDTQTGTVKPYVNPLGTPFAPIQDNGAFATCP